MGMKVGSTNILLPEMRRCPISVWSVTSGDRTCVVKEVQSRIIDEVRLLLVTLS